MYDVVFDLFSRDAKFGRPRRPGLMGWEPGDSGLTAAAIRTAGIPSERYDGILIPEGRQLGWYPPTHGAPMSIGRGGA